MPRGPIFDLGHLAQLVHHLADDGSSCAIPITQGEAWTWLRFAASLISVQLGFMDLVLAVVVDSAARSRGCSKDKLEVVGRETVNKSGDE